jgi:anti-sigma factor RsiW
MTHPTREQWLDYFSGEAADEAALEAHLFACAACAEAAAGVAAVVTALREMVPPLLTGEALARLHARGVRVVEQPLLPGGPHEVVFPDHADILLFRLGGLALAGAQAVEFTMRAEASGEVLWVEPAPVEAGEVLVACQRHFAALPANTVAEVRTRDAGGQESVTRYTIHHRFPANV